MIPGTINAYQPDLMATQRFTPFSKADISTTFICEDPVHDDIRCRDCQLDGQPGINAAINSTDAEIPSTRPIMIYAIDGGIRMRYTPAATSAQA